MTVPQQYRGRDDVEVAILEALVARREGGMTVFELRSHVDADIETLETALNELHADSLITVEHAEHRSVIRPAEHVVPAEETDDDSGVVLQHIRQRIDIIRRIIRR